MAYEGFKSGGFDMRGDAILTPATVNGYDPENVKSYELGLKGAPRPPAELQLRGCSTPTTPTSRSPPGADGDRLVASFVDNVGSSTI